MRMDKKILIVEDDLISAEYLKELLEKEGYKIVDIVTTGKKALKKCKEEEIDLVLMDIMLEDSMSGCEAALEIRKINPEIKIIFLTAYAQDDMIEYAYDAKAYGYLTKPYREKEILATVKLAFSHKDENVKETSPTKVKLKDGYIYDLQKHRLFKNGKEVPLTKKSLELMEILVKNRNQSVSKEQISMHLWGEVKEVSTLRTLIYRLRKILGKNFIENVNNMGYKLKLE